MREVLYAGLFRQAEQVIGLPRSGTEHSFQEPLQARHRVSHQYDAQGTLYCSRYGKNHRNDYSWEPLLERVRWTAGPGQPDPWV